MSTMNAWSVYLIRTTSGVLYAGIATDVDRRFREHGLGRGAKCLRGRGPLVIVYRRKLGSRSLALRVEHRLKRLTKSEKESIVRAAPSRLRLLKALELRASEAELERSSSASHDALRGICRLRC